MIKLTNIYKKFNDKIIFKDLNLEFNDNQFYAIMGNSGCGKTTLASIIAGLTKADSGKISLNGKISFVFQEDRLLNHLSALENLNIVSPDQNKNINILTSLGLKKDINSLSSKLSGGMKRRVAIGRALAFEHDILILDEPFKGLDEQTLYDTLNLIKISENKKILILITHSLEEARSLGCKIITLTDIVKENNI